MATAAGTSSNLADAGARVLAGGQVAGQSAFIQMRAKPPPATFSSKALSFYSNEN